MSYSSVQVDAARIVHGSRASMNYTNSTFDGPHIPSKPSSHRTFLSSERMQVADLNAVLASRPEVFRTPSKVRVPDSPLLEDSSERRVLASNTAPFSRTKPHLPLHFRSLRQSSSQWLSGLPSQTAAASSLESTSFVSNKGSSSISTRIASPRVT